jgi:hypothetical protein
MVPRSFGGKIMNIEIEIDKTLGMDNPISFDTPSQITVKEFGQDRIVELHPDNLVAGSHCEGVWVGTTEHTSYYVAQSQLIGFYRKAYELRVFRTLPELLLHKHDYPNFLQDLLILRNDHIHKLAIPNCDFKSFFPRLEEEMREVTFLMITYFNEMVDGQPEYKEFACGVFRTDVVDVWEVSDLAVDCFPIGLENLHQVKQAVRLKYPEVQEYYPTTEAQLLCLELLIKPYIRKGDVNEISEDPI